MNEARTDRELVDAVRAGDATAFAELFERWADRCYDVANRILHDEGRAAEVTQEVFTMAWQRLDTLRDPAAFGGWVLRSARNGALNKLRNERRTTTTPDDDPALRDLDSGRSTEAEAEALDHQELVWAAAASLGERDASILDLHLRHDLSVPEIADELGVTTNNAHQLLFRMKERLGAGVRAYVLVRRGQPSCPALAVQLTDAEATTFGPDAVKVINKHVKACEDCGHRQAAVLDPAALFAAAPIVGMGVLLRAEVAHGLAEGGVPVQPATGGTGSVGSDGSTGSGELARASRGRRSLVIGLAVAAVLLAIIAAIVLTGGDDAPDDAATAPATTVVDGRGAGDDPSPTTTAPTATTTTTEPARDDLVGSWTADASTILDANTANLGGPGGLTCSGPITMVFGSDGAFTRSGDVTCSVAGTSRSGTVASAGRYAVEGSVLTISGTSTSGTSPDAFGDGTATYDISGDTLMITFAETAVGTVTQTYQRT